MTSVENKEDCAKIRDIHETTSKTVLGTPLRKK